MRLLYFLLKCLLEGLKLRRKVVSNDRGKQQIKHVHRNDLTRIRTG